MAASFVPLTGIDEENILLTLHTRKHSNAKVVTEINRSSFKDVINSLAGSLGKLDGITAKSTYSKV